MGKTNIGHASKSIVMIMSKNCPSAFQKFIVMGDWTVEHWQNHVIVKCQDFMNNIQQISRWSTMWTNAVQR